ncbi:oligogalacturonate-specific porin KdgM family protein [Vibrio ulleungensis]|uniref:Porin n=1 Tax=Vibrio ulleungensis TaxID=2807619 RepID=A0ABS2HLV5_9VIBR|nr:oligogalacturonate-specific porin KdgM family protein [Vibrio ulleungensis]MBM7037193.1 porin [Vibrio ulleungensis]
MNKLSKVSIAVATMIAATAVSATSINLRHEYNTTGGDYKNRDRITVAHRFDNGIGFSVEAKWKHKDGGFLTDMVSNGHEVGMSYNYKIGESFTLQPAYAADSSADGTAVTHKYNLRGIQQITDNWDASLRYRYGDKRAPEGDNSNYHQLNFVTSYKLGWGKVGMDLEYKDLEEGGYKDKASDHLVNFFGEYNGFESGWIPFAEVGVVTWDKNNDGTKETHGMRYRVGVKYNF